MVEKETEISNPQNNYFFGGTSAVLNKEVYEFKREDLPIVIELLKDTYPFLNLSNYKLLSRVAKEELDLDISESNFERYYSPSIEGIALDYKHKIETNE